MFNIKSIKAFSLIELLVVITIVGLLAAIAVPAYQSYSVRAKINSTMGPPIDQLKQQMTDYYNKNGIFPDAEAMGYTTSVDGATITNPSLFGSKILYGAAFPGSVQTPCFTSFGQFAVGMDAFDLGIDYNTFVIMYYMYEDYNSKTLSTFCIEGNESGVTNTNYFCQPVSFTPDNDGTNETAYISNLVCP